jgi:citrate lyase subunit beta/citryl-CoA lyase
MNDLMVRLSRSQLFVPASRMDMLEKAASSEADSVCMDLEDSVAPDQKETARKNIVDTLQKLDFGARVRTVRINALDTSLAYRDVIEIVETAGDKLDLIMLPKVQDATDVSFLDSLLTQIESYKGFSHRIGIEAQIESASGFVHLREIGKSSKRLEALIFGPGDYAASMNMPLASIGEVDEHDVVYPGHRWHAVMHAIVAVSRANGLRCMDGPFANYKDEAGLENACRIALAMGFDGKQCIHPAQLGLTNTIFSPSKKELEWAQAVVEAYKIALNEGRGAVSLDGKMIDAANVRLAQIILKRQQAIQDKV